MSQGDDTPPADRPLALDELHAGLFRPYLEGTFTAEAGSGETLALTLVEVNELPRSTPRWAKRTGFSLLFRGPVEPVWRQGTYALSHPELGRLEAVFLVPITGAADPREPAITYELILN